MYAIFVPPIVVLFLVGVFDKKGNANGAYLTLILGTILGIIIFILQQLGIWNIHFTINAGIIVAISTIIFVLTSRMSAPANAEIIENFTFQRRLINQDNETSIWYQNYMIWAGMLFIFIVIIFVTLFK